MERFDWELHNTCRLDSYVQDCNLEGKLVCQWLCWLSESLWNKIYAHLDYDKVERNGLISLNSCGEAWSVNPAYDILQHSAKIIWKKNFNYFFSFNLLDWKFISIAFIAYFSCSSYYFDTNIRIFWILNNSLYVDFCERISSKRTVHG